MFLLIEFKEEPLAEYVNSALRRHGVDSQVYNVGVFPDGSPVFAIACFLTAEMDQARHLLYTSHEFLGDIHPEAAFVLQKIRQENNRRLLGWFASKPVKIVAAAGLIVGVLGYLFGD